MRHHAAAYLFGKRFQRIEKLIGRIDTIFKNRQLIQRFRQSHFTAFQLGQQNGTQFKLPQHPVVGIQQVDHQTGTGFFKVSPAPVPGTEKSKQLKRGDNVRDHRRCQPQIKFAEMIG